MKNGVTLIDPTTIRLSADTEFGRDIIVHPHVIFGPNVKVEEGVEIKPFSHIEGATIGKNAIIGPYARLRPGTRIDKDAHIGNFVEIKQTHVEEGAKINHLT